MQLLVGLVCSVAIVQACGSSPEKKRVMRSEDAGAGGQAGGDGATPSPGGDGPVDDGGAGGSATNAAGQAGLTGEGGLGGGGNEVLGGAAGQGTVLDLTACDQPSDSCCDGAVCGGSLSCAGDKCTCVGQGSGALVTRSDGLLLRVDSAGTPIKSSVTGTTLDQVTSAWQGHYHGCASRADHTAWCWASDAAGNNQGQLGNGVTAVTSPLYSAVQVQVSPGQQASPVYLANVKSIQQGFGGYLAATACAVTTDGAIYCWGVKTDGNLMQTGQNESYATPVKASANAAITDAVQLALGGRHACYVNTSGAVYCWGANIGGALGNGSETASLYPVRAGALTGVSKVVAGPDVSCALVGSGADAGRVYCWGSSTYLTLGIGDPSQSTDGCINYCKTSPVRVKVDANTYLDGVVDIAAGYQTTCVLRNDKSLWCWGTSGGSYASLIEAPSGTPVTDVAAIGVSSGQPRVLLTDGTYWGIDGSQRTLLNVACGLLD